MRTLLLFISGLVIGLLGFATWRFFSYHSTAVHYHANFAVYVNGSREPFAADSYYEGVMNCYADEANQPTERAHMHDHVSDLVHVEATAVTWGQFFQNLGWGIGPTYLQTNNQLLAASTTRPLTYWLNSQPVTNPAELVIRDKDKLLVSYGTANKIQLTTQFNSIPSTAVQADTTIDPASCSGPAQADWQTRLQHIFQ